MQWLQPWSFFWAAFVIPAILFLYLLKRRYTDRTIASTFLWQRVMQQLEVTRPWQKLQRHLLLILQLLAAILLIASLARPAVPTDGVNADHTVVLLDTSASMLTQEAEADRLTLAKQEAIRLAQSLQGEQTMTVVEAGNPPRVIASETGDSGLLEQRLNDLHIRYESSDARQSLSLARALASRHEHSEVILISDGSGWEFEQSLSPDRFIAIGKHKQNLSIAQLSAVQQGNHIEGLARLENKGTEPLAGTLKLFDERDNVLDTQAIEVEPSRPHVITWSVLPASAFYRAEVEAEHDALAADNTFWAVPITSATYEALYVGKNNTFLAKALRLNNRLQIVEAAKGKATDLQNRERYPLVIADGAGEGLPETGNGLFFHPDVNFAGWNWAPKEEQPQESIQQADHPILEHLSFKDVYIAKARSLDTPPGWQTIVHSGDLPLILASEQEGRRHVMFTFDLKQSDLPLRPEFPVLMHQIVNWLMPQERASLSNVQVGDASVMPVSAGAVTVTSPSGETTTLQSESSSAIYTPQQVGLYTVQTEETEDAVQYFTVPFPEAETDIAPQTNLPTQQNDNGSDHTGSKATAGVAEVGNWFVLAVLLILGVEWVVFARGY